MQQRNRGGRPQRILSDQEFEQIKAMVRIQCTKDEITDVMRMDEKTLTKCLKQRGEKGFSDFYKRHQGEGKASLRRAQWKAATEGHNPTMLVWLGKQMLNQRDSVDLMHDGDAPSLNININSDAPVKDVRVTRSQS